MADKSPGVVGKSQAVLTTQSAVASHHTSTVSTLKLCRQAAGATGGFVRQCEAVGTGRLAARGTRDRVKRTLLRWTRY